MSAQNKGIIRSVIENWNRGNPTGWDDLCTSDFVHHGRVDRDLENFKEAYVGLRNSFPDGFFTIDAMIAEGDKVAVRYTFKGTHTGLYENVAATGVRFSLSGMMIWRLVGSRIAENWIFFDRLALLEQIGAYPKLSQGE